MQAMVLPEWGGEFVAETRPVPTPGPGEVLVRVVACGAGLTLQNVRAGLLGGEAPRIMGHELGGVVAELGAGVGGWHVGDRVTATFNLICGRCRWCASGREPLCEHHAGYIGAAVDGAFAEYAVVPAHNLVAVPSGVDLRLAGVISDAVATPYHAARERARVIPGQRVAVLGAGGGVGVHMVGMARAFGGDVTAVERDPAKAERLEELGLGRVVRVADGQTAEALLDSVGGEFDVVFDCFSSAATFQLGLNSLGRGGTLVIIGARTDVLGGIGSIDMINKEKAIVASRNVTRAEIRETLELVAEGRVPVHVGASYPLERLSEAFEAIAANAVFGRIVIDITDEHEL
jgi:propanol-preferring alcohol dehydrogenase